ncbi:GNAT family N-acetyltransferase [uncultured Methylobacterium sp.]|uniref:GNAT family N-acetyltransferase n=1 Tax=uncultured Methylobacterium sp. TaxID=157278 RepID=UPI0035C9B8B7
MPRAVPTEIRLARAADRAAVEAIVAAAYAPYVARIGRNPAPMDDDYAALIAAGRVHVLVVEGAVRGLVVLIPRADALFIDNVAVAPELRGRGLGRSLLRFAEAAARRSGLDTIRLCTNEAMTENRALYARIGFAETGRGEQAGFKRIDMVKRLAPV